MIRRRALPALLATLAAGAAPAVVAGADAPLDALMRAFAARRESRARFTEEKAIPELDIPLPSWGTLAWTAPDRLEKRTLGPVEEVLRVQGDRLELERPQQGVRHALSLDQSPEIRPLVEAIRATLAGDLATLRRHYDVAFDGAPDGEWTMALTPLSARVRAAVQRITLRGRGPAVLATESQAGGGTTRMRIEPDGGGR